MNYSVHLVQRGISASIHPVTGKSGKLYGQAVLSPQHGGALFVMSGKDYVEAMHDLVGNPAAGQQWVPEFVTGEVAMAHHKCDRCSKPAVAIWDRFYYCGDHAPNNASYLDGSGYVGGSTAAPPAGAAAARDTALSAPVEERLTPKIDERTELPPEHMRAPVIGTEVEDSPPPKGQAGTFEPDKKPAPAPPPNPQPTPPVPPAQPPPPVAAPKPATAPAGVSAVETITTAVVERVASVIPDIVNKVLDQRLAAPPDKATPPPPAQERSTRKPAKAKTRPARTASEFGQLQQEAKSLGINSYGKNAATLRAEIDSAKNPPAPAAKAAPVGNAVEEEIPF